MANPNTPPTKFGYLFLIVGNPWPLSPKNILLKVFSFVFIEFPGTRLGGVFLNECQPELLKAEASVFFSVKEPIKGLELGE